MSEKAPISASQMLNRPRLSTASDTDIPIGFWSGSSRAPTRRSRSARDLFAREAMADILTEEQQAVLLVQRALDSPQGHRARRGGPRGEHRGRR